jgi:hypothetical protein
MNNIFRDFSLTSEEWETLNKKFGMLASFAAWQLKRKNAQNNLIDMDIEDIIQDLRIALLYAGAYYKRQCYLEDCLQTAENYVQDHFTKQVLEELKSLWKNRTRHGASRQKFGEFQEKLLNLIIKNYVPPEKQPNPKGELRIDKKFTTYCKQITWNKQKNLGKRISRDRSVRSGSVSLSEYDYLSAGKLSTNHDFNID